MSVFKEDNQNVSMIRVMSFVALLASIGAAYMTLTVETAKDAGIYITSLFLMAAFAPKVVQKFIEQKIPIQPIQKPKK